LETESLCSILKACSEAGVAQLKMEGLALDFNPRSKAAVLDNPIEVSDADLKRDDQRLFEEELQVKKQRLEEMGLTDPDELEELMESESLDGGQETT